VTETATRFRVYEDAGPPPKTSGPPRKWGYLPMEGISVNDMIELTMTEEEVKGKINAIRSYAGRMTKSTGKKFSIRVTDYGIGIWRTK
tara:strand:+ start:769 stop:1032 length:264 start_codon:yes stop_codon:yes gene_type:complete